MAPVVDEIDSVWTALDFVIELNIGCIFEVFVDGWRNQRSNGRRHSMLDSQSDTLTLISIHHPLEQ
jgi:hypothetical protein